MTDPQYIFFKVQSNYKELPKKLIDKDLSFLKSFGHRMKHLIAWKFSTRLCALSHPGEVPCFFPTDFWVIPGEKKKAAHQIGCPTNCPSVDFYNEYHSIGEEQERQLQSYQVQYKGTISNISRIYDAQSILSINRLKARRDSNNFENIFNMTEQNAYHLRGFDPYKEDTQTVPNFVDQPRSCNTERELFLGVEHEISSSVPYKTMSYSNEMSAVKINEGEVEKGLRYYGYEIDTYSSTICERPKQSFSNFEQDCWTSVDECATSRMVQELSNLVEMVKNQLSES